MKKLKEIIIDYTSRLNVYFFEIIKLSHSLSDFKFHRHKLILLSGPSTSGKSSITRAIKNLKPNIIELDYDLIVQDRLTKYFFGRHNKIFTAIFNRFGRNSIHYVFTYKKIDTICYNTEISAQEFKCLQISAKKEIKNIAHVTRLEIADLARRLVKLNFLIICQVAGFNSLSYFADFDPFISLVYCPLKILMNRIKLRNSKAISNNQLLEIRHAGETIMQFNKFFRVINRNRPNKDSLVNIVSHHLGFMPTKKMKFHYISDTGSEDSNVCANSILESFIRRKR